MGWSERISAGRPAMAIAVCCLLFAPGCSSGQKSGSASATGSVVASKPLPPLAVDRAMSIPGAWRTEHVFAKPGHWSAGWFEAAANADDFQGDLEVRLENPEMTAAGPALRRPLFLPKAEPRAVEGSFFYPWRAISFDPYVGHHSLRLSQPDLNCTVSLVGRGRRRSDLTTSFRTTELKDHQAIFCILTAHPERYNFYAGLDVFTAPYVDRGSITEAVHYRLAIVEDGLRAPLPSQATGWTTVAYVLWDGYDPTRLTDAQQTALVDWLHWGGRLLVSGPASLATLERSFLAPYLPARDKGTITLDAKDVEPFERWRAPKQAPLFASHPWPAVKLEVDKRAEPLVPPAADPVPLVVERRIGRGRVVLTAFSLSELDLADWPSFDSLLSSCLMRRPPRTILPQRDEEGLRWLNASSPEAWFDPTLISDVHYVARDEGGTPPPDGLRIRDTRFSLHSADPVPGPGVAAWRDDNGVVEEARTFVTANARIKIPDSQFVVNVVGIYFLVLVPLNWLVFRFLVGRPEWAWFAAPLIAAGCSVAVVRLAQLDVGFSRATNEAVVVELQPGHPRAHVSRFVAVYNSLGTEYEIRGDDPSTVALPMPRKKSTDGAAIAESADLSEWQIRRVVEGESDYAAVDGFLVESNQVKLVRAEHMRDVGGAIRFEPIGVNRYRITNDTRLDLIECRISGIRSGQFERLPPGATVDVQLQDGSRSFEVKTESRQLEPMRSTLEKQRFGELRLTALATDDVGGMTVTPQPSQVTRTTFVVAHLEYDNPSPVPDGAIRRPHRRPVH